MKNFIKKIIKQIMYMLHIDLTRNQQYDRQTALVFKKVLKENSSCLDVGCHKGEVLDFMLLNAPKGKHHGFEPLPDLYKNLVEKFSGRCSIHNVALSDSTGEATFNYVVNDPAYSGFKKREYDKGDAQVSEIKVKKEKIDNLIPSDLKVDLIKIDVEGAELEVLKGGVETIKRSKPVIVFEHGLGAADVYGTKPEDIYGLLHDNCGLQVSTMRNWLKRKPAFSKEEFSRQFYQKKNYYFIAYS